MITRDTRPLIILTSMFENRHILQLDIEDYNPFMPRPSFSEYDRDLTFSSSPTRSSSPPRTPHSLRRDSGSAYIRSSPDVSLDSVYRNIWDRSKHPPSRISYYDHQDAFYSKDAYNHCLDFAAFKRDDPLTSEEEDVSGTQRTTFFRVSAERGRWRSDPTSLPFVKSKFPTLTERNSSPTFSRELTPPSTTRTVSEPAPSSISSHMTGPNLNRQPDEPVAEVPRTPLGLTEAQLSPLTPSPSIDLKRDDRIPPLQAFPSLNADMDGDVEFDIPEALSSPLPPSSPPLSILSRSMSIISRSSSPLTFLTGGNSSPLSELSGDYDGDESEDDEDFIFNNALDLQISQPSVKLDGAIKNSDHASSVQPADLDVERESSKTQLSPSTCSGDSLAFSPVIPNVPILSKDVMSLTAGASHIAPLTDVADAGKTVNREVITADSDVFPPNTLPVIGVNKRRQSWNSDKPSALKDKNGVVHRSSNPVQPSTSRSKPEERDEICDTERRIKKQGVEERDDRKSSDAKGKRVERKKRLKRDEEEDVENDGSTSVTTGPRHKKLKRMESDSRPTKISKSGHRTLPLSRTEEDQIDEPLDPEARDLHATVSGLVIETMATSRASSLPASSICKLVMCSQPYLKSQHPERDWLRIFERVLRDGSADHGSGVFGKVESSGKDSSDRPLEAQWFYVPERDEDQERAALIRSMMPRPGKRTETMKYKQYYWRPLERISKWDSEDAL